MLSTEHCLEKCCCFSEDTESNFKICNPNKRKLWWMCVDSNQTKSSFNPFRKSFIVSIAIKTCSKNKLSHVKHKHTAQTKVNILHFPDHVLKHMIRKKLMVLCLN